MCRIVQVIETNAVILLVWFCISLNRRISQNSWKRNTFFYPCALCLRFCSHFVKSVCILTWEPSCLHFSFTFCLFVHRNGKEDFQKETDSWVQATVCIQTNSPISNDQDHWIKDGLLDCSLRWWFIAWQEKNKWQRRPSMSLLQIVLKYGCFLASPSFFVAVEDIYVVNFTDGQKDYILLLCCRVSLQIYCI